MYILPDSQYLLQLMLYAAPPAAQALSSFVLSLIQAWQSYTLPVYLLFADFQQ